MAVIDEVVIVPANDKEIEEVEPQLKGGDDEPGNDEDQHKMCPFCWTKGPVGCVFMWFFMTLGVLCYVFGFALKCFVKIVTCPCPGSTLCVCVAGLADCLVNMPATFGKCLAGYCPC